MIKILTTVLAFFLASSVISSNVYAHGASAVAGEWLPVIDERGKSEAAILSQIQSSPLGNEILVQYEGEGKLEVLGDDNEPFIRITKSGVYANWDHPMWFKVQTAGPRPLPEWVTDQKLESKWTQVSERNYYGWYDKRLEKTDEHAERWNIVLAVNGQRQDLSGYFKSLTPPSKRTLVTVDNKAAPIADLTAMVIPGPERAIRVSYQGDHHMVVLDEYDEPMLRFSPKGVEANTQSKGWKQLGRSPVDSDAKWVKLSAQAAYTWPDSRLDNDEQEKWKIPVFCHQDKKVKFIQGGWVEIARL